MLKPEKMAKILVAGHKKDLSKAIEVLHQKKVLHIIEHKRGQLDIGAPLKEGEDASLLLIQIRGLISMLGIKRKQPRKELKFLNIRDSKKDISSFYAIVQKRLEELAKANAAIEQKKKQLETLEKLSFFKGELEIIGRIKSLSFFIGEIKNAEELANAVKKITSSFDLQTSTGKGKSFVILAIEKSVEQKTTAELQNLGFKPEQLEHIKDFKGTPKDNLLRIYPEYHKLIKKREGIDASLNTFRSRLSSSIMLQESYLEKLTEKTEAPLKMAMTQNTFMVTGWLPEKSKDETIKTLQAALKGKVAVEDAPIDELERVPVKLKNPALVQPFEFFLDLYSLPNHHEIDPTLFIFIGFPIFFGMMLGDIGYGIVSVILFLTLMKLMPQMKGLFKVMLLSGISTIIFGFVFGEFFGLEELFGHEIPFLIHRTHAIQEMLMISVAIGVCHVVLGLLIGFYNELHHHGLIKAVNAKLGWIVLLAGAGILLNDIAIKAFAIPNGSLIGGALVAISIVMLFLGEGVRGLVELPGIFGNILSYARLMALGVASAGLAVVINDLAAPMFNAGVFGIIAGIIILFVGHLINFMLGLIGPFLHSLRLQYVEFFTKFYAGGGTRYIPFGTK
ncbi:MAG: V-type ATP synthase subunit I [Nanoarchaeota archaeon]